MVDKWWIASNDDPAKVLSQSGWTASRRFGLVFPSEEDAHAHIQRRRIAGHTARADEAELAAAPGMPGAAQTEYDPYGLNRRRA